MPKFRKKPIVIEAEQFTHNHMPKGINISGGITKFYYIKTLEGDMTTFYSDWIITGIEGEKYPCKDSIFRSTYEPLDQD